MLPATIFADGGIIGKNPSRVGGTWCYLWVSGQGRKLYTEHGIVSPQDHGLQTVGNNLTELLAVLRAVQSVPPEWDGTVFTDSLITYHRFTSSPFTSFRGIPQDLTREVFRLRGEHRFRMGHLKGHPTRKELQEGRSRCGRMVSIFNVYCDKTCGRIGREHLTRLSAENGQNT